MAAEYVVRGGKRIREKREAAGLTQDELAERLPGKANGTQVSKWELGKHKPGDDTLEHIAKALDCTVADFYIDKSDAEPADLMATLRPDDLAKQLRRIDLRLGRIERSQTALAEIADRLAEIEIWAARRPKRKPASDNAKAGGESEG